MIYDSHDRLRLLLIISIVIQLLNHNYFFEEWNDCD